MLDEFLPRAFDQYLDQDLPRARLKCYSLPYGALGFISHILTYYTIVCLLYGRKPLWPFKSIHNTRLDLILGGIGLVVCVVMSALTMVRCRNAWQPLVIAIWKMSMSLLNGCTALHVAILVVRRENQKKKREEEEEKRNKGDEKTEVDVESESVKEIERPVNAKQAAWWIILYIPGMISGMAGLMSLVTKAAKYDSDILRLTIAFYFVVGSTLIVGLISMFIIWYRGGGSPFKVALTGLGVTLTLFIVLSALYSDWCIGMMMGNILGTPSGDKSAFYWSYWAAKRLTMFSW